MKIKTLIVDDEPLARERIRALIGAEPDVEVVGECANGREALAAIEQAPPDLLFLDVQMPEMDGFELLSALDPGKLPAVIFVTAFDKFALRAFEVHALDYLLKPFDRERFQQALQRARERLQRRESGDLSSRLTALLADLRPEAALTDRFAIKTEGRVLFLKIDEIDWIESADNYVCLHVGKETHLHRETLTALEAKLAAKNFIRISRSTLINLRRIKELQSLFHGDGVVILQNGARLSFSRNYRAKLEQVLGQMP